VTPDAAAPQLLTLDDKLVALQELGRTRSSSCRSAGGSPTPRPTGSCQTCSLTRSTRPRLWSARISASAAVRRERSRRSGASAHNTTSEVITTPLVTVDREPVTSTRIRGLVARGEVDAAARLLGRLHRVRGRVVRGRSLGRELGVPTANVTPVKYSALPSDGVYAGRFIVGDDAYAAGISVGRPPTFPQARDYLEAHLVGFDGSLYGEEVALEFVRRLRDQARVRVQRGPRRGDP